MTFWTFHWMLPIATEAVEATEKSGGLFDIGATLPIMVAQFLILVAILNVVFFKPLTKAIDDRNDYVRNNISDAKERLEKATALAQQYEQELATARKSAQAMILAATDEAAKHRAQQIANAMEQSQAQLTSAKAEVEAQKRAAEDSLNAQVEALSRQILDKILGDLVHS
jgi:F-type H+-transporting ATPase subunit b